MVEIVAQRESRMTGGDAPLRNPFPYNLMQMLANRAGATIRKRRSPLKKSAERFRVTVICNLGSIWPLIAGSLV
jgi:hypothetical protein